MSEFWNWMTEWGFPMLVMFGVLRLDAWWKARRKRRQDADLARIHAEMAAECSARHPERQ